jgi:hypothetical protein
LTDKKLSLSTLKDSHLLASEEIFSFEMLDWFKTGRSCVRLSIESSKWKIFEFEFVYLLTHYGLKVNIAAFSFTDCLIKYGLNCMSRSYQDSKCGPVVEPEGGVVDVALLGLEVSGETSEGTIHLESSLVAPLESLKFFQVF